MKKIKLLLLSAMACGMFSCLIGSDGYRVPVEVDGNSRVILRLRAPGGFSSPRTRGVDEDRIDRVTVLAFNSDDILTAVKPAENLSSSDGNAQFQVRLVPSKRTEDTYKLVALVNVPTDLVTDKMLGATYEEVRQSLNLTIEGKMFIPAAPIPMWGETKQIVVAPVETIQNVTLVRAVARIDVGVGTSDINDNWTGEDVNGVQVPFELTSVCVVGANNTYSLIPLKRGEIYIPGSSKRFSVDDSRRLFTYPTTFYGYTQGEIYVPEALVKTDDPEARISLVLGGEWGGHDLETFYRVDFITPKGEAFDVMRNCLYRFNITSVTGFGSDTPEEAAVTISKNMTVGIEAWDRIDFDTPLNGVDKISPIYNTVVDTEGFGDANAYPKEGRKGDKIKFYIKLYTGHRFMGWQFSGHSTKSSPDPEVTLTVEESTIGALATFDRTRSILRVIYIAADGTKGEIYTSPLTYWGNNPGVSVTIPVRPGEMIDSWDLSGLKGPYRPGYTDLTKHWACDEKKLPVGEYTTPQSVQFWSYDNIVDGQTYDAIVIYKYGKQGSSTPRSTMSVAVDPMDISKGFTKWASDDVIDETVGSGKGGAFNNLDSCGEGYNWGDAMAGGSGSGTDGSICPSGWRLPTGIELFRLINLNHTDPSQFIDQGYGQTGKFTTVTYAPTTENLHATIVAKTPGSGSITLYDNGKKEGPVYWSSTGHTSGSAAWCLHFYSYRLAGSSIYYVKNGTHHVRCVKGN